MISLSHFSFFFFFNDTATTEIYTLSLHDALPISHEHPDWIKTEFQDRTRWGCPLGDPETNQIPQDCPAGNPDRKSTRLNSSHTVISYAVFCLKKKKISSR